MSKVIIVTGASGGIGKACAAYLAAKGNRVYGTSRRSPEGIDESGAFPMVRMDVTDQSQVAAAIRLVREREGRIDAVVNNAGLHIIGPLECVSVDDIETSWRTNCLGAILVCREVAPIMRAQGGGRIINVSSVGGVIGLPFQGAYSGSKYALEGMTDILRGELRPFGISVSLIEPGDIRHQDSHGEAEVSPAYAESYARAMKVAWADEEKGYPAERIGPLVARILASPRPKARYGFGQAFQALVPILKRLLPGRLVEAGVRAYYHT